jgi:predicted DNA-binding transcriptional regulator AlpA
MSRGHGQRGKWFPSQTCCRVEASRVSTLVRFNHLRDARIIENRTQLKRLQKRKSHPFPKGKWVGENSLAWTAEEVVDWVVNCPVEEVEDEAAA